jgi:transcriptional regulator with XRE-family HTH domain
MPESSVVGFSGRRLAAIRKRRRMSQMDLAVAIDMHYASVANWERGIKTPTPASLRKLARALRCRESALLEREAA